MSTIGVMSTQSLTQAEEIVVELVMRETNLRCLLREVLADECCSYCGSVSCTQARRDTDEDCVGCLYGRCAKELR